MRIAWTCRIGLNTADYHCNLSMNSLKQLGLGAPLTGPLKGMLNETTNTPVAAYPACAPGTMIQWFPLLDDLQPPPMTMQKTWTRHEDGSSPWSPQHKTAGHLLPDGTAQSFEWLIRIQSYQSILLSTWWVNLWIQTWRKHQWCPATSALLTSQKVNSATSKCQRTPGTLSQLHFQSPNATVSISRI